MKPEARQVLEDALLEQGFSRQRIAMAIEVLEDPCSLVVSSTALRETWAMPPLTWRRLGDPVHPDIETWSTCTRRERRLLDILREGGRQAIGNLTALEIYQRQVEQLAQLARVYPENMLRREYLGEFPSPADASADAGLPAGPQRPAPGRLAEPKDGDTRSRAPANLAAGVPDDVAAEAAQPRRELDVPGADGEQADPVEP